MKQLPLTVQDELYVSTGFILLVASCFERPKKSDKHTGTTTQKRPADIEMPAVSIKRVSGVAYGVAIGPTLFEISGGKRHHPGAFICAVGLWVFVIRRIRGGLGFWERGTHIRRPRRVSFSLESRLWAEQS